MNTQSPTRGSDTTKHHGEENAFVSTKKNMGFSESESGAPAGQIFLFNPTY